MKVLIANHHTASVPGIDDALALRGHRALHSWNIVETIALLEHEEPDVLVFQPLTSDIHGFEIRHVLNCSAEPRPQILLLLEMPESMNSLLESPVDVDDFVLRPFDKDEFLVRLQINLSRVVRIRQLEKITRSLERESITDFKTGLYNDRFFFQRLEEEVNRSARHGLALSVIMFDFDNFKLINDEFDHVFGDFVLLAFARKLRSVIRQIDIPARFGGDEFAVLLPNTDLEEAAQLASRLQDHLSDHRFEKDGHSAHLTLSMGVNSIQGDASMQSETFLRTADLALLEAKRRGKNRICLAPELAAVQHRVASA
jgi:diguanylate cyclase (GGDEF)-like protein